MLTRKQLALLDFIHQRVKRDGVPPSFDEMRLALNLRSKSGIHRLITALEERGFVRRLAHKARAIEIIRMPEALSGKGDGGFTPRVIDGDRPDGLYDSLSANARPVAPSSVEVRVLGRIAAGKPIEAIEDGARTRAVPGEMLSGKGRHYALEVRGDSMIGVGIHDGDLVVVRETAEAESGDIVVAQIEGYEATLKRFRRRGGMIALEAANPAHETRVLPEGAVRVQGRLVGLIRTY